MQKLGVRLVEAGVLSAAQFEEAARLAEAKYRPLATVLLEGRFAPESALLPLLAEEYRMVFLHAEDLVASPESVRAVPPKLAAHYGVLPMKLDGGVLMLAVSNPLDTSAAEDIQTNLGLKVERALACRADIQAALRRYYGVGAETVERILADGTHESGEGGVGVEESTDLEKMAEDASVVRLVNQILQDAIKDSATDIHFEAYRDGVGCRRRIDGVLYETHLPRNTRVLYPAIVSRIKLMSGLDIVERRLPQDGRTRVTIGQADYDLRVSVVPAIHGEDIVVRILPATMLLSLEQLGLSQVHLTTLRSLIARPHGILFVTGPTGSGKSTTLYACLRELNSQDRKVVTIEDPVEYELKGLTQTQVNPKIGLTFARMLRSMLRHDPDVMMVGEVRDRETAEIAIQTAMTGHLVLSTLHTNDAAGAAVRLMDMGMDAYLIVSTVLAFIAQRLVRVVCTDCREPYRQGDDTFYRGRGCRRCNQSGFRGRIAICEFLTLEPEIQSLVLAHKSAADVRAKASAMGMRTLEEDGWDKVRRGLTTAEEVRRVTLA
jgi:type II secretory ATPase GspE/PulE/Tfp pilus assembly ATPase PilB-like protein